MKSSLTEGFMMNLLLKYDANMNLHYFVLPPAPQLPEHNMYWYLPLLEMYPWSFSWTSLEVSCSPCQKLLSCKNFPLRLPLRGSHTGIVNSAVETHLLPRKSGLVNWYDSTRCSIFGCFLGKGWLVLMLNCDRFSHPYLIDIIHESTAFTLIVLGSGLGCSRF